MSTLYENSSTPDWNYTEADLEAANDERAITLLPAMIVLGILMIIGIVGNSLVCYVFCFRLKSGTQNFLIVCLAVLDLLSCSLAIPNEIADMRFYYDYSSVGACKIMRFINTFCAIGSIFTLLVIAIDRYRKICKPFHGQIHMKHVRLSLIPIFGTAILFSWPAFVMYGLRTMETEIPGLHGRDCSTPDGIVDTIYPLLYNLILFLCFIILAVTLTILYSFVLRETKRHNRYLKRNSDFNLPPSYHNNSEDSQSSPQVVPGHISSLFTTLASQNATNSVQFPYGSNSTVNNFIDQRSSQQQPLCMTRSEDTTQNESTDQNKSLETFPQSESEMAKTTSSFTDSSISLNNIDLQLSSPSCSSRSTSSILSSSNGNRKKELRIAVSDTSLPSRNHSSIKLRRRFRSKTTLIAFLVSLVFVLSFLPHLCLQVTKMLSKGFDYNLQGPALVAYNIFLRSYFINSVSNPIIYGALNTHFSKEVSILIKKVSNKL